MEKTEKFAMYRAGEKRKNAGEIWLVPQSDAEMARKMAKSLMCDGYELVGMIAAQLRPEEIRSGMAYQAERELYKANEALGRIQAYMAQWK